MWTFNISLSNCWHIECYKREFGVPWMHKTGGPDLVLGMTEGLFRKVMCDLKPEEWVGLTRFVDGSKTGKWSMWFISVASKKMHSLYGKASAFVLCWAQRNKIKNSQAWDKKQFETQSGPEGCSEFMFKEEGVEQTEGSENNSFCCDREGAFLRQGLWLHSPILLSPEPL